MFADVELTVVAEPNLAEYSGTCKTPNYRIKDQEAQSGDNGEFYYRPFHSMMEGEYGMLLPALIKSRPSPDSGISQGCAEPAVTLGVRQALRAILAGRPRARRYRLAVACNLPTIC